MTVEIFGSGGAVECREKTIDGKGFEDASWSRNEGMQLARRKPLAVGHGNFVLPERVVAILNPASSPMRRLREEARAEGKLVDATQGRKTRAIVLTDSSHVVLSAVQAETLTQRLLQEGDGK